MENSNCDSNTVIPVTKTKVSGESQSHDSRDNALPIESTDSIAEDDINDVKVCDICGDIGYEEMLVICSKCNEGAEHIYCMQTLLEAVPTEDWFCEGCNLKQKERNRKKLEAITKSQTPSSSGQDTGKQGICRNSSSKILGLDKLNTSSEKMQTQNSEGSCKRQIGGSNGASVSKKQAIECGNLVVNVSQPALQRNNSLKPQETNKADGYGILPQIKNSVRPSYTRDGSFKMPEAGKSEGGDSSGAPVNKKQAIECGNLAVNVCQPALQRNNSLKPQETNKPDGCGVLPQIKSSVRPSYTRDGSLKMPEAGKSDSGTMSLNAYSNSSPRPFSRENSFKTAETTKVKFLPSHSVAGLRSGVPLKASSKSNAVDENSNIASPRTGIANSRSFSPRSGSSLMTDSSGPLINRSGLPGLQSFPRQTLVNSSLRSVGLSNSNDALPYFLLSSRSNNPSRAHSIFRSSTEAGSGNSAGQLSGTKGNMKNNNSRISFPASSSYLKDSQNSTSRNLEMKGTLKQSAVKFLVDESRDDKSDVDISASPILTQGNCRLDESIPLAKGNLPMTAASAEQKSFTAVASAIQPQKLVSVELKGSAMARETPTRSVLTKKVVNDNASTECLNLSEYVKEDPDGINVKPIEGGLNICELSHKDSTIELPASALFEGDIGDSTLSNAPESMPLLMADIAGSSALKDKLPEEKNLSLIKVSEVLTFGKDEHESLHPTNVEYNVAVSVGEDPELSASSKNIFLSSLPNRINERNPLKTSADMLVEKVSRLNSTPEPLIDNSPLVEASQRAATLQTMTNIVSEMVPGTENSRKEVKLKSTSSVKDKGNSDTSTYISNGVTGKPINGSSKDLFRLEESIVKPTLPASVAQAFAREVIVPTRAEICISKLSEIDVPSSALMQTHTFGPSEMTSLSISASKDIATVATLNGGSRPASESFWRGGFKVINKVIGHKFYDGIQAYLANKASPKVYEVSRKFPSELHLEQVQRCSAWPKRFKVTPPTDGDIAVYIFPSEIERCQIPYFELLEVMVKQDLALSVYLEGAELLIFSSNHLPENYHRFSGQMYLWGVFRSGIASADLQGSFPDCNYVGSKVLQVGPSSLLAKNNDMLPKQLTCTDNSGYSEGEEDMDVDMEGGREIGMAERPAPRPISQLAHLVVNNASQLSCPSSSTPILSHCENSKSVLPPGSELPPGFDHSSGFSRNSSENSSILRLHEKLQEREITPGFRFPEGKELPNKKMLPGSFSQGWNSLPITGLGSMVFPPGLQPAAVKFLPSYRNCQPVFGPATRNAPRLALNHLPFTQHASLKPPSSSLECPPGFKATFPNQILFSSDHPPGIKPAPAKPHLTLLECRPGFQPSLKHSLSSLDCPPGIEPAAGMPPLPPSECPAGLEHASWNCPLSSSGHHLAVEPDAMKPPLSYSEYPPGFEPAFGNHSLSSSCHLPGNESTAKKSLLSSIQCSPGFHPASGNRSLSSSDCPPSFELAADKSLLSSSVYPLKHLVSEQLQDSVVKDKLDLQPEVQYEIQPSRQCSSYLSPREDDSSRSHIKAEHVYGSREFKCSHSFASIHRPLSYLDHPRAVEPVAMKPPPPSISEYPPGCEPVFGNHSLSHSDCPPGSEPAAEKHPLSSTHCSPSFVTARNCSLSSSDCLPSFELAAENSLLHYSVHPLKHPVSVELQDLVVKDKLDLQPNVQYEIQTRRQHSAYLSSREDSSRSHIKADRAYESREFKCSHSLASIHPSLSSSDHPPAVEPVALKPPSSVSEYPPGCEPAFGSPSTSDLPPGSVPAAKKCPQSSRHCSPSFEPASGNRSLSSSDCPPGFKLAAEIALLPSSDHALEHLVSVQVQDSVMKDKLDSQPEVQYEIRPTMQCSAYLTSKEDDSRSHIKADLGHESREFKCSHPLASIHRPLSSSDHPTAGEAVSMKPPLSNSEYHPGLEPSFGKHSLSFSDCPPGSKPTAEKHPLSSTQFSPGFEHVSGNRSFSSDYPPNFELAAKKSLLSSSVHSVEHLLSEHRQDKNDLEPEVQNEIRTNRQCSAYFSTREDDSRSHPKTDHAYGRREFNQSCSFAPINHPLSSSDHPPAVEAAAMKPPLCNLEYPPVSGNHSLSYADRPPSFELTAKKSLLPSSVRPLKILVSEQLQDSVMQDQLDLEPEFQNEIQQSRQHSPYLSSRKYGSRNNLKRDHAHRSREFKRSRSLASMDTDLDRTRNSPWMCKSKSFKEELYNNRRRKEDRIEGDLRSYREKGDGREGDKSSNKEKESMRERGRSSSREKGDARKKARSSNRETENRRERGRSCSREKEDRGERGRNSSREKQDMRKGAREYIERENGGARDTRHHRHHSRYSGTMRHKEHEKHSSSFSYCNSHSGSTTQSYSPLRENGRKEATANLLSHQQVNSFNSNSSIVLSRYKKPSLDKDSESGENDIANCLYKANAPMNDDHYRSCNEGNYSAQLMKSESCSLEVKNKVFKIKLNETSVDDDHAPLWDLNNEATCDLKFSDEKSCGEATCQLPIQANISDPTNSRSDYASHFGQGEHVIPEVRNWCAGSSSTLAIASSLECLPLFPCEDGDCGPGEVTVNDWDFNLEVGHGHWGLNRETLPLLEQSLLQRHTCNFMLDDGASASMSMPIYDDSRDGSSTMLSLSIPQYRKQGNTWVEVTKDIEQSDQNDAVVKLTLSLFS